MSLHAEQMSGEPTYSLACPSGVCFMQMRAGVTGAGVVMSNMEIAQICLSLRFGSFLWLERLLNPLVPTGNPLDMILEISTP